MSDKKNNLLSINKDELNFCEYFVSLEGEGHTIGESVLFMRLSGGCGKSGICSCKFCDTKYSWDRKSEHWSLSDPEFKRKLISEIAGRNIRRVTLTGGEPLKYCNGFYDFAKEMQEILPNLGFIGIESNGAMLSTEHNALEILKQFNWINKLGIEINLTMSPKIDYSASWYTHKKYNQTKINKLYFHVFNNAENIIMPYKIFYKFIYDYTDKIIPWKHTELFINELEKLKVPRERIMLMALTPDDPEGEDKTIWEESQRKTARKALQLGVRYSPRLQVNLGLE